ncbi:MAG: substrate-binding domain-containing protein [Opitutales bacterium]|nr:substrate-binding domain-containing protein [Opitutales bacterium]
MIAFSSVIQVQLFVAWSVGILAAYAILFGWLCRFRRFVKGSAFVFLFSVVAFFAMMFFRWFTVDRYQQVSDEIPLWDYRPFVEDNRLVKVVPEECYRLSGDLPKIDGAYALYPLYAAAVEALYPKTDFESSYVGSHGSDFIFEELLAGRVDLIFGARPSQRQQDAAAAAGLSFEITPFAREAFVFFVNADNPVDNLSSQQIRDIYSGKIKDWKEVGAPKSRAVKAFQRNEGSGSQTMLQKIMAGTPIMPPLKEDRLGGMGGIINDVADYRNRKEAIGFSFRYFATEMFYNGQIKLLSVDGVAPTRENIANGSYPFVGDCCVITVRPRSRNIQKLVDFLFSAEGEKIILETGYTPIKN